MSGQEKVSGREKVAGYARCTRCQAPGNRFAVVVGGATYETLRFCDNCACPEGRCLQPRGHDGAHSSCAPEIALQQPEKVFRLNSRQATHAKVWIDAHRKVCVAEGTPAIGGRWSYTFNITSIGVVAWVRCALCDATRDVTDYEEF